ncbi:MAG: exodeoxyribonuclease VII large subunit [Proteobacteria bacterium]|nr:exodeoxyribonuclease VII large subunit [Pseudomonadota bacterium]
MQPFPEDPQDFEPASSDKILSVSNLNRLAKSLLEGHFPAVLVEGEISNLAMPTSGHWYLTLKDKNSQVRCAMFANRNRMVHFKPQNGKQVLVRGRLSIYEGRGDYQLIADGMEEAGDGVLRRAFEELKARLLAEGLFSADTKQQIASHYDHIGVVTSPGGAVIRDILSVFKRRFPATRITLFPVVVQGTDAAPEIVRAIAMANQLRDKLGLQALIIGRGGGSLEDLQAFNEEAVARAIFASDLPITSAVGHQTDFTIADFVADLRAPTPSAAAEQMSPSQSEYSESLEAYAQQFRQSIRTRLQAAATAVNWLQKQLKRPDRRLQEQAQHLDRLEGQMVLAMRNRVALLAGELRQLKRGLQANSPAQRISTLQTQLAGSFRRVKQSIQVFLNTRQATLGQLSRSLSAVSPLSTLSRGYSITYNADMQVIRKSDDVRIGSEIISRLAKGSITATVNAKLGDDGKETQ